MPSKKQTPSVFVRGIPFTVTDEELSTHFSAVAPVKRAFIVRDPRTRTSRGFGFVQFAFEDDAGLAAQRLNGSELGGRPLNVEVSSDRVRPAGEDKAKGGKPEFGKPEGGKPREERAAREPKPAAPALAAAVEPDAASAPASSSSAAAAAPAPKKTRADKHTAGASVAAASAAAIAPAEHASSSAGAGAHSSSAAAAAARPFAGPMTTRRLLTLPIGERMKRVIVFGLPLPSAPSAGDAAAPAAAGADAGSDDDAASDAGSDAAGDGAAASSDAVRKVFWKRARKLKGIVGGSANVHAGKFAKGKNTGTDGAGAPGSGGAGEGGMLWPVRLEGNKSLTGAVLTFESKNARDKAMARLDGHSLHGAALTARRLEEVLLPTAAHTTARLIVRNLRFTADVGQIERAFIRAGAPATVTHIHVPAAKGGAPAAAASDAEAEGGKMAEDDDHSDSGSDAGSDAGSDDAGSGSDADAGADGATKPAGKGKGKRKGPRVVRPRNRGFAFLEFATRADAAAAVKAMGAGHKVARRVVAVDWVLSPEQQAAAAAAAAASAAAGGAAAAADDAAKADNGDADGDDKSSVSLESDAEGEGEGDAAAGSGDEDDDEGSEGDDESDAGSEEGEGEGAGDGPAYTADAVEAGTTVFIRNVPFDASESDVYSAMRAFGPLRYARLVIDRDTGRPRGTAFVQYYQKEASDRALEAAGAADDYSGASAAAAAAGMTQAQLARLPLKDRKRASQAAAVASALADGGVKISGRTLLLSRALPKDEAARLVAEAGGSGAKGSASGVRYDKRHLYLQWEGHIRPDSALGQAMPIGDRNRREAAAKERKTKLVSPLFFVSPTRLSVRNLARHVDDYALRRLCLQAARAGVQAGLVSPTEGDPLLRLELRPWPRPMPPSRFAAAASAAGKGADAKKPADEVAEDAGDAADADADAASDAEAAASEPAAVAAAPMSLEDADAAYAAARPGKAPLHPLLRDGPLVRVTMAKVMREGGAEALMAAKVARREAAARGGAGAAAADHDDGTDSEGDGHDGDDAGSKPAAGPQAKGGKGGKDGKGKDKGKERVRFEEDGATPRSRGFGFVEFQHHMHALACLRQLNNNPQYSAQFAAGGSAASRKPDGDKPRLIVEFSVEDWRAVKRQERKKEERDAAREGAREARAQRRSEEPAGQDDEGEGSAGAGGARGFKGPGAKRGRPSDGAGARDGPAGAGAGAFKRPREGASSDRGGARGPGRFDRRDGGDDRRNDSRERRDGSRPPFGREDRGDRGDRDGGRARFDGRRDAPRGAPAADSRSHGRPDARGKASAAAAPSHGDGEISAVLSRAGMDTDRAGRMGGRKSGGGDDSRGSRRAGRKTEASEDATHDRLVAEYKAKLFG